MGPLAMRQWDHRPKAHWSRAQGYGPWYVVLGVKGGSMSTVAAYGLTWLMTLQIHAYSFSKTRHPSSSIQHAHAHAHWTCANPLHLMKFLSQTHAFRLLKHVLNWFLLTLSTLHDVFSILRFAALPWVCVVICQMANHNQPFFSGLGWHSGHAFCAVFRGK